jgi:type I restriction enzyme S subunit
MPSLSNGKRAGWTTVALGDVVDVVTSYWDQDTTIPERLVAGEHIDEGDLRIRRWAMTDDDLIPPTFNRRFQSGDVLLHSRNLKKVARPDFAGITGEKLFILRSKDEAILLQDLVPYLVASESFRHYAESRWAGSTNKFLNKEPLTEFEFMLPPIGEQRRISRAVIAARRVRERLFDVHQFGETLRDSLLVRLIGNSRISATSVNSSDHRWEYLPLGDRYEVALGKMLSPKARAGAEQVPYMRNANVQWGRLDLSDVATMSIPASERERYSLKPGDILACEGRHVGKSVIWNNEIPGACYQKALHRLRPLHPELDEPRYLLLCLRLYSVTGRLVEATGETTIPHLPAERFREILFPFPRRAVQESICERIARLDETLDEVKRRVIGANSLSESIANRLAT